MIREGRLESGVASLCVRAVHSTLRLFFFAPCFVLRARELDWDGGELRGHSGFVEERLVRGLAWGFALCVCGVREEDRHWALGLVACRVVVVRSSRPLHSMREGERRGSM